MPAPRTLRQYVEREQHALRTGIWGPWEAVPDRPRGSGWLAEVHAVWKNRAFVILVRTVPTGWGPVEHLAIRNCSEKDIAWRDMQRIKDELYGPERVAVEVFPPQMELVDEANMYHLWILPSEFELPFTLLGRGHRRGQPGPGGTP